MQNNEPNKLILEERKRLNMTGVESVDSFSDTTIKLTVGGSQSQIGGERLKILTYNKSTGALTVDGFINEIKYNTKKQPLLKRLFK